MAPWVGGAVAVIVVLAGMWFFDRSEAENFFEEKRDHVLAETFGVRVKLEEGLNARLHLAWGLAAFVGADPDFFDEAFEEFANELWQGQTGVRSLQLARGGVVSHVYPVAGNEPAIGHDLFADPGRREAMERAVNQRQFIVAGPMNLRQGGVGLVGRLPIFVREAKSERFWGLAMIVVDLERLLAEAGLLAKKRDILFSLRGTDGQGGQGGVFFGDPAVFVPDALVMSIGLPNGEWQIAAMPAAGWPKSWHGRAWLIVIGIPSALVVGWLVFFSAHKHISLQKTLEDLHESKQTTRSILRSTAEGIYGVDAEGLCNVCNDSAARLLGYDNPRRLLGQEMHALIHHSHEDGTPYARRACRIYQAFQEGKRAHVDDEVFWRRDGSSFPVEYWSDPISEDGRTVGAVVTFFDITERKEAEEARRESEALFRAVVNRSPAKIHIKDVNGRYLLINKEAEKVFGITDEEGHGKTAHDLFPKEVADAFMDDDRSVMETGNIVEAEETFTRDDRDHTYLTVKFPIYDQDELVAVGAIGTDITDHKNTELQLRQAQKMEAVGNLTGGIAHDFNNILGIVLGNLQLLKRRLKDEVRFQGLIEAAIDATHHGADLTKQLLAFSRRQELDPRVLDVNELVAGMDKILRRTLGEQIVIETMLADDLGLTKVDPAQLESTILNLALNARDAMPRGGRLLIETANAELDDDYVATHAYTTAGPYVCISVCDTGTGIAKELRDRIFEPFFTTKEVGKGTGLGLSMVYGFVKQSGGHVNVYSEDGHGTRFRIYLPRSDAVAADAEAGEAAGGDDLPRGTETVLLVEDNEQFRRTAALLLEDLGYTVVSEADGPNALKALERAPNIDLLFTDMVMPGGINGHELAQSARKLRPGLSVLLTSGYPRDAFSEGRDFPLLSKPYTDAELARMTRAVLDGRQKTEN